jgi:hypothetical protein
MHFHYLILLSLHSEMFRHCNAIFRDYIQSLKPFVTFDLLPSIYSYMFRQCRAQTCQCEVTIMSHTACIKMIGAVWKLIVFTSMVNRIINTSRNGRVTLQVYDTYLQMFDVCTLRPTAHIEALVQFLPYSDQQVRCDGRHRRFSSVLPIRYAHGLWWHKHFVLHVTPKEIVTRG